ncbi:MAG: hypothetical protein P8Y70_03255 [Candidatus Lokiarchaeota archaeon]
MEKWLKKSLIVVGILVAIVPLGILITWDKTAWGEWGSVNDPSTGIHWTPQSFFSGLLHDYNVFGWSSQLMASIGYWISAIIGIALTGLTIYAINKYILKRSQRKKVKELDKSNNQTN